MSEENKVLEENLETETEDNATPATEQVTTPVVVVPPAEPKKTWSQKRAEKKLAKATRKLEKAKLNLQVKAHPDDATLKAQLSAMNREDLIALAKKLGIAAAAGMGTLVLIGKIVKALAGKAEDDSDSVDVTYSETSESNE